MLPWQVTMKGPILYAPLFPATTIGMKWLEHVKKLYIALSLCMYCHTYSKSMDQPGKVANPARGQLNRKNEYFPVRVRAWEFGLARRVRQSRPASACSSPYSGWIWCLVTGFLPSSAAASIIYTANRHRASPEFIGSRNRVPMALTAESPPAQGQ